MAGYLVLGIFTMLFCMVERRLAMTILTAPIAFISFGVLIAQFQILPTEGSEKLLHLVAEIALVVLLFLDAAQIDMVALSKRHIWPQRMLMLGMPIGFMLGAFF